MKITEPNEIQSEVKWNFIYTIIITFFIWAFENHVYLNFCERWNEKYLYYSFGGAKNNRSLLLKVEQTCVFMADSSTFFFGKCLPTLTCASLHNVCTINAVQDEQVHEQFHVYSKSIKCAAFVLQAVEEHSVLFQVSRVVW